MTQQQQEEVNLLKELIADSSISADERMIYEDALSELMKSEKPKASTERKPKATTERKPRTTTQRKPQAPKQSKSDIELAKAEIKRRTGKTEEECESIVNEYRSLRAKSVERKKKESVASAENKDRVAKLKKDDKIISGTSEKTADAVIESTTKDVAEKIVKEIDKIEQKAEVEATKEVKKEMPKESTTEQNKAIAEKTEEKVKEKTKTIVKRIVIDTSSLLTSIAESLGKFDKDSQKEFLIKLRSDIDKLLAKFSVGGTTMGATQGYNITQSNLSSSSVNPTMFAEGGMVGNEIEFSYYGEPRMGRIYEEFEGGSYAVQSGSSKMLVDKENILRTIEPTKRRSFGFFEQGGGVRIGSDGREYPFGSAWALEHNKNNKSEKYEVPLSSRKKKRFDEGGGVEENEDYFVIINYYEPNAKEDRFGNKLTYYRKTFNVEASSKDESIKKATNLFNSVKANKNRQIESIISSNVSSFKNMPLQKYPPNRKFNQGGYVDLFEDYENIPLKVQEILDEYDLEEDGDYDTLLELQNRLETIGYTFEYELDAMPFALRPMGVKLNQLKGYEDSDEEEFAEGGEVNNEDYFFDEDDYENN